MADPIDKQDQNILAQDFNWYGASATGNDTYEITGVGGVATAYKAGRIIVFKADVGNTAACSLNINNIGAKNIKRWAGTGLRDLITGEILATQYNAVTYDATNDCWVLLNPSSVAPLVGSTSASVSGSGTSFTSDDDSNVVSITTLKSSRFLLLFTGAETGVTTNSQNQTFVVSFNVDNDTTILQGYSRTDPPTSPVVNPPASCFRYTDVLSVGSHTFRMRIAGTSVSSMSRGISGTLMAIEIPS